MIINLTINSSSADERSKGVVDLAEERKKHLAELLSFNTLPSEQEMKDRANDVALLAMFNDLGVMKKTLLFYRP